MPQPALHVLIATAVLDHWKQSAHYAPFPITAATQQAFLHGSLGPDFGLFPGGDEAFSDIAHRGNTGALQRALLRHARTDTQTAFAWGWLTHILGDVAIHPLVNRAAAASATGLGALADHVRVEAGLDAHFAWRHTVLSSLRLQRVFDTADYTFVSRAYFDTHDYFIDPEQLMKMQSGVLSMANLALRFATSHARPLCWSDTVPPGYARAAGAAWRGAVSLAPRTSLLRAYLHPDRPDHDLIADVEAVLRGFVDTVDTWVAGGVQHLPDYNLETGSITPSGSDLRAA